MDENGADTWTIQLPENIKVTKVELNNENDYYYKRYETSWSGNTLTLTMRQPYGFMPEMEFTVYFRTEGVLDDLAAIDGTPTNHIRPIKQQQKQIVFAAVFLL